MTTKLLTIEEAIAARLEEKRIAREKEEQAELKRREEILRRESLVAGLFRQWLSREYQLDPSGLVIKARIDHQDLYRATIETANDGRIDFGQPMRLIESGQDVPNIDILRTGFGSYPFHATIPDGRNGDRLYVDFDNLVDALIYAIHGTSRPELREDAQDEDIPF